jgi:hypothetical protein
MLQVCRQHSAASMGGTRLELVRADVLALPFGPYREQVLGEEDLVRHLLTKLQQLGGS